MLIPRLSSFLKLWFLPSKPTQQGNIFLYFVSKLVFPDSTIFLPTNLQYIQSRACQKNWPPLLVILSDYFKTWKFLDSCFPSSFKLILFNKVMKILTRRCAAALIDLLFLKSCLFVRFKIALFEINRELCSPLWNRFFTKLNAYNQKLLLTLLSKNTPTWLILPAFFSYSSMKMFLKKKKR